MIQGTSDASPDGGRAPAAAATAIRRPEPRRADPDDAARPIPTGLNLTRDRVRWGPIVAGLLAAVTALLAMGLLGLAVGLTAVDAGRGAALGAAPADAGRNAALWGGLSALVAFALGGFFAARSAAVFDRNWGMLNGALVFLLAVPIVLWLAAQGLGAAFGALGSLAATLDPGQGLDAARAAAGQAQQAAAGVTPADASQAAAAARDGAWGALAAIGAGVLASALGGAAGTRREVTVDPATGRLTD